MTVHTEPKLSRQELAERLSQGVRTYELGEVEDFYIPIDADKSLADENAAEKGLGLKGRVVAEVKVGDLSNKDYGSKGLLVVDVRGNPEYPEDLGFLIVDDGNFSLERGESKPGFKGIYRDKPETFGRAHHKARFKYPDTVSRHHFEIEYNEEGLVVRNLNPENQTSVSVASETLPETPKEIDMRDDRSQYAIGRAQILPGYQESDKAALDGYFLGRPILTRNAKEIDGGIYLGASTREAIVVDGESEVMDKAYDRLVRKLEKLKAPDEKRILEMVKDHVRKEMPYDGKKTEAISAPYKGDKPVDLSTYIENRAGVCRHQCLLSAYLVEKLIMAGILNGRAGVERNSERKVGGDAHAWAIFESSGSDEKYVIDASHDFVGTKREAKQRRNGWDYSLTTD
jgi:hypothetical protein